MTRFNVLRNDCVANKFHYRPQIAPPLGVSVGVNGQAEERYAKLVKVALHHATEPVARSDLLVNGEHGVGERFGTPFDQSARALKN